MENCKHFSLGLQFSLHRVKLKHHVPKWEKEEFMKCQFCGAQLEEHNAICPECGEKNLIEAKTKEYISPWKIVLATAVVVILLAILTVVLINSITERSWPFDLFTKPTTAAPDPTGATEALKGPEDLGMGIEGVTDIAVYASDEAAALSAADEIVATVGEYSLTNSMLQIFYWTEFSNFVVDATEDGADLVGSYNLDITKPMNEQLVVGTTVTWEQYFLHNALTTWWRYAAVNAMADAAGFELSEESRASLDAVPAQLEEDAKEAGFENAEALIKERLGAACDLADYVAYMELTARGDLYYAEYQKNYIPTEEEVKAFFEQNADYYGYYGITADSGKLAAVRHVLLTPEGAEQDATTGYVTATDEQWAAGEQAAQAMLDAWVKAGAKEEDFATMANEHSTDGGSNTKGGLYEDVLKGQMVEAFDAWVFDQSRKPGDYGIVKTEFGHHLMYFVSLSENDAWYERAYADAISYGYGFSNALAAAVDQNKLVPQLDKVVLTDVAQEATEEETTEAPTESTEGSVETTGATE